MKMNKARYHTKSNKLKYPLRRIVGLIRHGDGLFGLDKVELECGHTARSNAQIKARCKECYKQLTNQPNDSTQ